MAQHISRRELKKDEVRETLAQGADAILSHRLSSLIVLVVALVAAVGYLGWKSYTQRETVKASAAFDAGSKIFEARTRVAGEAAVPGQVSYADDAMKYSEAAQKFSDAAAKYPRTRPGQLAAYYAALSYEKIGKNAEAKKSLEGLVNGNDPGLTGLAKYALAQVDEKLGQGDEAAKLYQQLIDKPSDFVPKSVAMLALAQYYSHSKPAEAARLYAQIKMEFPDTPIAEQADQQLALLPSGSGKS